MMRRQFPGRVAPALVFLFVFVVVVGNWYTLDARRAVHPVTGRPIADVMSHLGADWLDRTEREREEAPSKAVAALGLRPGDVVADVGAGSGYYSVLLSRAVGATGKVYATDIQPQMLDLLRQKLRRERITNVEAVLATETDPRLAAASLDVAILVDVYHELSYPQATMRSLARALKPGGRLVLVEFRKEDPRVPIREEHKMSVDEARRELEADGFRLDRVIDVLPWQHILVFVAAPA